MAASFPCTSNVTNAEQLARVADQAADVKILLCSYFAAELMAGPTDVAAAVTRLTFGRE